MEPPIYNSQPRSTLDVWKLRCQSLHTSESMMLFSATGWKDAKVKGIASASLSPRDHLVTASCQQAASPPWVAPISVTLSQMLHRRNLLWAIIGGPIPASRQRLAARSCSSGESLQGVFGKTEDGSSAVWSPTPLKEEECT